jgi:hypothetical protein
VADFAGLIICLFIILSVKAGKLRTSNIEH